MLEQDKSNRWWKPMVLTRVLCCMVSDCATEINLGNDNFEVKLCNKKENRYNHFNAGKKEKNSEVKPRPP